MSCCPGLFHDGDAGFDFVNCYEVSNDESQFFKVADFFVSSHFKPAVQASNKANHELESFFGRFSLVSAQPCMIFTSFFQPNMPVGWRVARFRTERGQLRSIDNANECRAALWQTEKES